MDRIEETACAKVNLDLRVCGRRSDGYHDLDSLVAFADIGDRLTFEPAASFRLTIGGLFGASLAADDGNLVTLAARALAGMADRAADVHITLDKRLPIASGLGGGSADAAATLRGLARLWKLPLGLADLAPLARTLGADVPVCLGSTAAHMQGTGGCLTPITPPENLSAVLVNPGQAVPTPDAFRALRTFSGPRGRTPEGDDGFRRHLAASVNDLEAPAIGIAPAIGEVLAALRRQPGCALARMSGSGATCFGLFDDPDLRRRAIGTISAARPGWWIEPAALR